MPWSEFNKLQDEIGLQQRKLKRTNNFVTVVLGAFFLTFVLVMVDAWRFSSLTKEKLYDKIEQFEKENRNKDIQRLEKQIEDLKNKHQLTNPSDKK